MNAGIISYFLLFFRASLNTIIPAIGIAIIASTSASADSYIGAGSAFLQIATDDIDNLNVINAVGRYGYQFSDYIAVETRFSLGLTEDSFTRNEKTADVSVKNFYGGYLKSNFLAINDDVSPYSFIGYTRGTVDVKGEDGSDDVSKNDFSFGLGVDFSIGSKGKISVEYANYLNKEGTDIGGYSLYYTIKL